MFPWSAPEGGGTDTSHNLRGSRKRMLEERALQSKHEGLAFERKPREAVRMVDTIGTVGYYQQRENARKGVPTRREPNPSPKLPSRDPGSTLRRKMPVNEALIASRSPYACTEDRFLATKPRPLFGASNGRSLLEEADAPLYSSFASDARFNLPPLPKLK